MGAGQFGCGLGPCGADPVYIPAAATPVLARRAVKYDPSIKQWVLLDASGNQIDVHPVDQMVAVRLTVEQGQSASSPTLGQRIRARINAAAPARHQQIALEECTRALQDLIDAGDVLLLSVVRSFDPVNGAVVFIPSYVNVRTADPRYPKQSATSAPPIALKA